MKKILYLVPFVAVAVMIAVWFVLVNIRPITPEIVSDHQNCSVGVLVSYRIGGTIYTFIDNDLYDAVLHSRSAGDDDATQERILVWDNHLLTDDPHPENTGYTVAEFDAFLEQAELDGDVVSHNGPQTVITWLDGVYNIYLNGTLCYQIDYPLTWIATAVG